MDSTQRSTRLKIKAFCLGEWMTNCYVVHARGPACWIVDAGFAPQPMLEHVRSNDLEPAAVLLTHAHVDHIAGLSEVRSAWPGVPILIHESERGFLADPMLNLSAILAAPVYSPDATGTLEHGATLELDGCRFDLRHTPGHSPGGVTLYHADGGVALVGDTLFAGSIGRTDFPTSNHDDLMASIHDQLMTLPDETRVLPGHGPETTIGRERGGNPFLQ